MADPEITTPVSATTSSNAKDPLLSKVLVVTDFSEEASAAIDLAMNLAKLAGTHLALLHIVEVPTYQIHPEVVAANKRVETTFETLRQRAMERLDALCDRVRKQGVSCTASARLGIPSEEILKEAERTNPDLIVLGNKGTSGLTRFLLGTTAERVVRHARCSVLVARVDLEGDR